MSDLEDEIQQRRHDMAVLEDPYSETVDGDEEALFRNSRPHQGDNPSLYKADDLDIATLMPGSSAGLDHKTGLRQEKWNELRADAPFIRVQPPSVLRGTLGGQQVVSSAVTPAPGNSAGGKPSALQVALWGGEDAETMPVTITFAPVQQFAAAIHPNLDGSPPTQEPARPYGIIQFGTRGFLVKAEVDIGLGCQFTVGASMVSLQVGLESVDPTLIPVTMKLAGMLSFFPCVRTSPITRTIYTSTPSDGATSDPIVVPPFAKSVRIMFAPTAAAPVAVVFYDSNFNTTTVIADVSVTAAQNGLSGYTLPGDCVFMQISSAGTISQARLIFALEF